MEVSAPRTVGNPRRLPPAAVRTLNSWFKANRRWPYPTNAQKNELVERTGLTKKKVDQWLTNTRRRSPLVTTFRRTEPKELIEEVKEPERKLGRTSAMEQYEKLQFCQCSDPVAQISMGDGLRIITGLRVNQSFIFLT